jgi:hypothetical protein
MVIDRAATVIAHSAHSIYDLPVLAQVARSVGAAVDAIGLIQDDWELLTASFADGKLLLRSLRTSGPRPRSYVLVVISDASLNVAFLGVALRVAAAKLVAELEVAPAAPPSAPVVPPSAPVAPPSMPAAAAAPEPVRSILARGSSGIHGDGVPPGSLGDVDVGGDPASAAFLTACTKALGRSLGPLAKLHIKEAVRKVCGERPFSRADGPALVAQVANVIEDSDDRATFQRATRAF